MSIEAYVRGYLVSDTGVASLIGERMRPSEAGPADIRPFVMYEVSRDDQIYSTSAPLSLRFVMLDMECWDDKLAGAGDVYSAIESAIYGLNFTSDNSGRFRIQGIFRATGPNTMALPDHKGANQAIQGVEMSYQVAYDDFTSGV